MKFNNKLLFVALASLAMAGCGDDWNEDKLDGFGEQPVTDVKTLEITLTDADYKTIATNSTNKSLAEAAGLSSELSKLTNNKYFTENITASKYLPAFLAATYYTADNGSSVKVTSNVLVGEPDYLAPFNKASYMQLEEEAYEEVWGDKVQAYFLTPKSENEIAKTLLPAALPEAQTGDMVMVEYAYSDVEPSIGGAAEEKTVWTQLAYPRRATGTDWNFTNIGLIDLSDYIGQTVHVGFKYTSTTSVCAKWELSNFKALTLPYLDIHLFIQAEDGSFKKIVKSSEIVAGSYLIAAVDHAGQYNLLTDLAASKNYGYFPVKAIAMSGNTISAADAEGCIVKLSAVDGGFTMQAPDGRYLSNDSKQKNYNLDAEMKDGGNYVWSIAVQKNSDAVSLSNATTGKSMKLNYYAKGNSYSYGCYAEDDMSSAVIVAGDDQFTIQDVNLDELNYIWSYDTKYACWVASAQFNKVNHETESFLVTPAITIPEDAALPYFTMDEAYKFAAEGATDLTVWISTNYKEPAAAANTRSVKGNKVALYKFDGSAWSKATVDAGQLAVMQPADYVSLSNGYVSKPENVLPKYVAANYPYAVADDVVVVAYLAGQDKVSAKELIFNGNDWVLTTNVATQVDQFVMADGKWNWDPSVTITLPSGKGQELSTLFFQAATDWVWEHVDQPAGCTNKGQGYVTSYGNNEYYCGCSAYQGNVDWRKSAAISGKPGEYDNMSDDEFLALMQKRFIEVMGHVLEGQYPDAQPVAGVKVTYTINFAVYTGTTVNWTIQYELTGVGKFTYIDKSLKKVE